MSGAPGTRQQITIAAAQYPIERLASLDAYAAKITGWVERASAAGADLLVFPEYGAMELAGCAGVQAETLAGSLTAAAEASAALRDHHGDLAVRHSLHILAASGPERRADGRFENVARLYAPSGKVGAQAKQIMTPFETGWGIVTDETLRVFETTLGVIGIAICYDSEFPLLVRAQVEAGAQIVLIPSCTEFVSGFHRVRTAALARALENGIVTVQSPTVGLAPWSPAVDANTGAAGIFAPAERGLSDNGVIAEGVLNVSDLVVATVDLAHLADVRAHGEMRNHRDWPLQAGAVPLGQHVERVELR